MSPPKSSAAARDLASRAKSLLTGRLVARAVRRFGIPEGAVRNLRSWGRLASSAGGGFPTELLPLGANMWSGYVLTSFARQLMEGWVLPYWLRLQSSPSSTSFVPHGHPWLTPNLTHRNWTGIGICGYPHEAVVDPAGLLTPWPFGPSVDVWLRVGDTLYCPSEMEGVDQELVDNLPIVRTRSGSGDLLLTTTCFVAPFDTLPVAVCLVEVSNGRPAAAHAEVVVSARPYNPESICAVNELAYDETARTFTADGSPLLYLPQAPDRVLLSDLAHGDVAMLLREERRKAPTGAGVRVSEPAGLATGAAVYELRLPGGGSSAVCFACPLAPGTHPGFSRMLSGRTAPPHAARALESQRVEWSRTAAEGMRLRASDASLQRAFEVNKAFLLMLFDGGSITPGPSTYHMMWFRDAAYLVPTLVRIGHPGKAADILAAYPDRQDGEGFFRSHDAEWDSNGQAMYALADYCLMTGDGGFLAEVWPSMVRGARWIERMLVEDLPAGDPGLGLLPAGVSAEHFGANDVYYWDDLWAVAGLRKSAEAGRGIGLDGDARRMEALAGRIWASLEASWRAVGRRLGMRVMPAGPGREVDAAAIGSVAAAYPLELLPADDPIMRNTVDELVRRCFHRDLHFHRIMHQGLNVYMSLEVAQCYLRRRDPYALKIFDAVLSAATDTGTYPEAINPLSGGGAYGDGHHGWAAAELVGFARSLLFIEEGDRLVLLPVPRSEWFEPGAVIEVEGAPTRFGDLSYRLDCGDESLVLVVGELSRPPSEIELVLPFEVERAGARGGPRAVPEGCRVTLDAAAGTVELVRRKS